MGRKKSNSSDLGRALAKKSGPKTTKRGGSGHGGVLPEIVTKEQAGGLTSVLDATDLAELMLNAELAERDFHSERGGEATLSVGSVVVGRTGAQSKNNSKELNEKLNQQVLRIPRRPKWGGLGKEGLEKLERESFLEWRKNIAEVEREMEGGAWGLLTPFEKNLQVWRQLWRVLERSDVVVQIVDARNPLLYYCADLKKYGDEELGRNVVLLVNKADLLSSTMISRWHSYFTLRKIEVIFFSAFHASIREQPRDKRVLGVEDLLQKLSSFPKRVPRTSSNSSERLVVGMVGYPNVGKSSTMNVLLEHAYSEHATKADSSESDHAPVMKRVAESSTPGRTKHFQTHVLNDHILLCDCPGLVFPNFSASKAELIICGVLSIDQMRGDAVTPVDLVARRIPCAIFEGMYGIRFGENSLKYIPGRMLLETHAKARGFMSDHDRPDISRSARQILKDYVTGRLLFSHPPPPADISAGEAGVGPAVFAKKGQLIRGREEAQKEELKNSSATGTVRDAMDGEITPKAKKRGKRKEKPPRDPMDTVFAHLAGGKKVGGQKTFTRVERSYFSKPASS